MRSILVILALLCAACGVDLSGTGSTTHSSEPADGDAAASDDAAGGDDADAASGTSGDAAATDIDGALSAPATDAGVASEAGIDGCDSDECKEKNKS